MVPGGRGGLLSPPGGEGEGREGRHPPALPPRHLGGPGDRDRPEEPLLRHLQEGGRLQCCGGWRYAGDDGTGGEAEGREAVTEPSPAAEYMVRKEGEEDDDDGDGDDDDDAGAA